jgi:hypothetical protein
MAHHTFACAAHRCLLDGIPGSRLPGSVVYPRFRPLRTSRRSGGYAVTPAPRGRDFHPHEELSYKADALRLARELMLSFSQRIARKCKRYCATAPSGMHHLGGVCHQDHPQPRRNPAGWRGMVVPLGMTGLMLGALPTGSRGTRWGCWDDAGPPSLPTHRQGEGGPQAQDQAKASWRQRAGAIGGGSAASCRGRRIFRITSPGVRAAMSRSAP